MLYKVKKTRSKETFAPEVYVKQVDLTKTSEEWEFIKVTVY